eukprot:8183671-Alexandrium_andersonii.AAC.1
MTCAGMHWRLPGLILPKRVLDGCVGVAAGSGGAAEAAAATAASVRVSSGWLRDGGLADHETKCGFLCSNTG